MFLEGYIDVFIPDLYKARYSGAKRYLDPVQELIIRAGLADGYKQIKGEVGNKRKRVCRIDALRCQKRKRSSGSGLSIHLPDAFRGTA